MNILLRFSHETSPKIPAFRKEEKTQSTPVPPLLPSSGLYLSGSQGDLQPGSNRQQQLIPS